MTTPTPAARRLRARIAAQLEAEPVDVPRDGPHSLRGFREHHNALEVLNRINDAKEKDAR